MTFRAHKQQRRSARAQRAVAHLRHFQLRIDLDADPLELAALLKLTDKVA